MLKLNKEKPILLLISILLLLIWFIYRWIYKKHKKWILTYYLRRIDMLDKNLKTINNLMIKHPNLLILKLATIAIHVIYKQEEFISCRVTEIINNDLTWRFRNE